MGRFTLGQLSRICDRAQASEGVGPLGSNSGRPYCAMILAIEVGSTRQFVSHNE